MKSIKEFLKNELPETNLGSIYGGKERATCTKDNNCDTHYDYNDDGKLDPGECIYVYEC